MAQIQEFWLEAKKPGPEQFGNRTAGVRVVLEDGDVPMNIVAEAKGVIGAILNGLETYPNLGTKAVVHYTHVTDSTTGEVGESWAEHGGERNAGS